MLPAVRLPADYAAHALVHEGHAGEIWRGVGPERRPLALKIAREADASWRQRFETEARSLASLTHRSIVRLHDHGATSDGRPFLALEWLEGPTLAQLLEERGAGIPPRDAIRLLLPIALALVVAHDRGVVHGSVRAEHVILLRADAASVLPKLVDFGEARRIAPSIAPPSVEQPTPRAHEQVDPGDPGADVRGFAAMTFHAIAGAPPFSGAGPSVPRTGLSERDGRLWRILAEALAPAPAPVPSVHELARDLALWADQRGLDTDITGSPVLSRWPDAARRESEPPKPPGAGTPRGGGRQP